MLKRERDRESGVRKATRSYRTFSIPGKTATLVPEFGVEDLHLDRIATLVLAFAVKYPTVSRALMIMVIMEIFLLKCLQCCTFVRNLYFFIMCLFYP